MFSRTRNEKGLSLMEVIIAGGLLIGVGVMMSKVTINANKGILNSERNLEMVSILSEIKNMLNTPEACFNTFEGFNAKTGAGLTDLKNSKDETVYKQGNKYGSTRLVIESLSLSDSDPGVTVTTGGTGTTHLVITFNRGAGNLAAKTITKRLKVLVNVNASDEIVSCNAAGESAEVWVNTAAISHNNYVIGLQENITIDGSASYTMMLPDSPPHGHTIEFVHGTGDLTANPVTINPGTGDTILTDTTVVLDVNLMSITLFFYDTDNDGNGDWRLL